MMKMSAFFLLILLVSAIPAFGNELLFGEKLQLQQAVKVSEINARPQKYIGKRVQIEGMVIDVCAARGCWMDIASDEPFRKIQVKVVDGEIVFPMEAKGRLARVEGIVEKLELTHEQALAWERHKARERGGRFDPSQVTGPVTIYRIRGVGAEIR